MAKQSREQRKKPIIRVAVRAILGNWYVTFGSTGGGLFAYKNSSLALLLASIFMTTNNSSGENWKNDVLSFIPAKVRSVLAIIIIVVAVILVTPLFFGEKSSSNSSASNRTTTTEENSDKPQLQLLNFSCSEEYGYFTISGQVKNISDKSLKNVTAEGTTYTKDGEYINSEDALISYNPILPGQVSPFKTMMTSNPAMAKCNVSFKYLFGGTINTDRSTLKK